MAEQDNDPVIPFGKYQGTRVSEIPNNERGNGYLKWLAEHQPTADFDFEVPDHIATAAQNELGNRN